MLCYNGHQIELSSNMPKKKKIKEEIIEEEGLMLGFEHALLDYKESFLKANYDLEQKKLDWFDLTSEIIDSIYEEVFYLRDGIYADIDFMDKSQKIEAYGVLIDNYSSSTGLTKRAFVDIRAYFISQGIC